MCRVKFVSVFVLLALLLSPGAGTVASGLAQPSSTETVLIAPSAGHQWGARISGDTVVWVQEDPGTAPPNVTARVWVKSLSSGRLFPVSNAPGLQEYPDVSGDLVVWADSRNSCPTCDRDIYGYRLSTGQSSPSPWGRPIKTTLPSPVR
jgi:beta propeller repeat protein